MDVPKGTDVRWMLCLLIGSLLVSACGDRNLRRLDVLHYAVLSQHLLPVRDGIDAGEAVQLGAALVIDSTTTEAGDRWILAEVESALNGRYRQYRLSGDHGLWLLTSNGKIFCANELACMVSDCPSTNAEPTQAQLRDLHSELAEIYGFLPVL